VHKSQLRQKQLEVGELQRSLAAKEREADSLRGSLAAAKRGYEQRHEHMEAQLAARNAEVRLRAQAVQP
jgi:maltodextrin utilization protein YvdJ